MLRDGLTSRLKSRPLGVTLVVLLAAGCGSTVGPQTQATRAPLGSELANPDGEQPPTSPQQSNVLTGSPESAGNVGRGTSPTASQPQPAAPSSASGAGPNSTPITTPIAMGFLEVDNSKSAAAVGFTSTPATSNDYARALVNTLNAHGGIAGRKIIPSYHTIDASTDDFVAATQAACAYFTQDKHVALVNFLGATVPAFSQCLKKAGVPEINGTASSQDEQIMNSTSGLFLPVGLTRDRQAVAVIDGMVSSGWLSKKDRVGVLVSGCPEDPRVYERVVAPRLARLGIAHETTQAFNCPTGLASLSEMASGTQSAALRFRTAGVTKVMYLTPIENFVNQLFSTYAENQSWKPGYLLDTNAMVMATKGSIPAGQLSQMKGVGWSPVTDLFTTRLPVTRAGKDCTTNVRSGNGPSPEDPGALATMFATCDMLTISQAALQGSRGSTRLADVVDSLEHLGTSFSAAASFGPVHLAKGLHDGVTLVNVFSYKSACSCVTYDGAPRSVPAL